MSDQITTIATLPAGYPTLAGVVYAIATTSRNVWGNIAWARMAEASVCLRSSLSERKNTASDDGDSDATVKPVCSKLLKLERVLTGKVTRSARNDAFDKNTDLAEREAAILHLIHTYRLAMLVTSSCEDSIHFRTLLAQAMAAEPGLFEIDATKRNLPLPGTDATTTGSGLLETGASKPALPLTGADAVTTGSRRLETDTDVVTTGSGLLEPGASKQALPLPSIDAVAKGFSLLQTDASKQALPSPNTDNNATNPISVAIDVRCLNSGFEARVKVVEVGLKELGQVTDDCRPPGVNRPANLVLDQVLQYARRPAFSRTVNVQLSASPDALFIDVIFKIIEILFACGIIVGSTGGAWLGLSLCSMFPVRISAGIFSSSFGQVLPDAPIYLPQRDTLPRQIDTARYRFRAAGTVWGRTDSQEEYSIKPTGLSDALRVAAGYTLQLALLFVFQQFKLSIRQALQFGPYQYTRDAVRYIVLVIVPTVLIIDGRRLLKRAASKGLENRRSNIICALIYTGMLCASWTCVLLGQKSFLKPLWKFYLVSKIIQPLAAIGSLALITFDDDKEVKVSREKWFLLWAIGACTIVW